MKRIQQSQQGFAAIAAIFLVVVLAALGAFMVTFSNTQQLTSAQDVQGSRAYWAARAGLEWALVAIPATAGLPGDLCPNSGLTTVVGSPTPIEGFTIRIRCSKNSYSEDVSTLRIYSMESQASLGGAAGAVGYVERSVSASIEF